jgi:5-formyltetrahydrofolate cyclo-ligase
LFRGLVGSEMCIRDSAKRPNMICIGVGYDWQQLGSAQWQAETHDEPLDAMLTESGLRFKGD